MKGFQQRVVDEKVELDDKRQALSAFFDGDIFPNLDEAEKVRLEEQYLAMNKYSEILGERIAAF